MNNPNIKQDIAERRDAIRAWLADAAPYVGTAQHHLEAGSSSQAYWSHGYAAALNDILGLLNARSEGYISGTSNH